MYVCVKEKKNSFKLTVCSYVTYAFQSEFRLYSCPSVKELLAQNSASLAKWLVRFELKDGGFDSCCSHLNSFEIHLIILRYIRNVNLPFKKGFKFAELLTKTSFLYGEGNKLSRCRKYMRENN